MELFKQLLNAGCGRPSTACGVARNIAKVWFSYQHITKHYDRRLIQAVFDYLSANDVVSMDAFINTVFKHVRPWRNATLTIVLSDTSTGAVFFTNAHPVIFTNFDWVEIVSYLTDLLETTHRELQGLDVQEVQSLLRLAGDRSRHGTKGGKGNAYIHYRADGGEYCARITLQMEIIQHDQ